MPVGDTWDVQKEQTVVVGAMKSLGALFTTAPVTKTADFTLADTETVVINNKTGSGRLLLMKTTQAQALNSASSNVVPKAGGAAGTAIASGTAGNWALMVSDGTNWVIMAGT